MEEDTPQSPNPTSMEEEDSSLPCLPNPPVPPDFLPSMIKFDLQSKQGNVLDLASKKLLVSRFIMKKISCYPNIQHIRSDQLEVTHFCEQLIVYMKLRFSHVAVSPKLTASNNYGISPMIPIPYDFFHTCFVYYKGLALSSLRNNFSATPQYSRCISTGLSRIPMMPYPPVPLAFMPTVLPLLSSEHNILVVQWGLNQTIQRILSFYPNLQYSPMDQLTVYHYFESVMEYYKEGRMLTPARKRLMWDLKRLEQDSLAGIGGAPLDNNFRLWNAVISGPDDTPWSGGTFKLTLQFSEDYPYKPPTVRFISRMFHPNIYSDGSMRLDILHNQWNPRYDVATILTSIRSLLCDPNPNCPANSEAARLFSENQDDYNRKVREIVEQSRWTAD